MSNRIIFIIGGARSGKSSFALKEASKISGKKAYIATAEALDGEMKIRIEKHRKDRGSKWDTYEEPLKITDILSDIKTKYDVVVIDCLTLWLSNLVSRTQKSEIRNQTTKARTQNTDNPPLPPFAKGGMGGFEHRTQIIENYVREFIEELNSLNRLNSLNSLNLFIISNEVGMGIVPDNEMAREFRDMTGVLNQKIAETADEVYIVTAGIPIKIKSSI